MIEKAVVLLSGGLDSTTCLAIAKQKGYECYGLSFDYGQRHRAELRAAESTAQRFGVSDYKVIPINLRAFGGSALTDDNIPVPESEELAEVEGGIPVTYVPARNTIFLAIALGWAEVLGAQHIFIGVNAVDYSGYPDCRPEFIDAFQTMAHLATKAGTEGHGPVFHTPLIDLSKADIIKLGLKLGVDYGLTTSCYQADDEGRACGLCDSCRLRRKGFEGACVADPTRYVS
ncbi:MAG: 7-cyano-7-deazaguanine synthase QueC [Pseudomonadales bacterium]|nr:7-cyano-7-deazaguanine synthase QueC [Pseudomonadales bacterium]